MRHIIFIVFFLGIGVTHAIAQGKWTPFVTSLEGSPPISAAFLNERFGFVKTDNAAFRTTDGGKTWTKLQAMPWTVSWSDAPSQFYFYAPNDVFLDGKYESIDSGNTWKQLLSPTPSGELYIKDGIFFDASGNVSYDHSTTWTTASGFQNEIINGNLDNDIAIWGEQNSAVVCTTDGGSSWLGGQNGPAANSGYVIPFTSTYFLAGTEGNIERSTDGAKTWLRVYIAAPGEYLSGFAIGIGCTIYAQTEMPNPYGTGFIRSTDEGESWQHIGGPVGLDEMPICGVCARGAVCFGMTYNRFYIRPPSLPIDIDTLWKFYDSSLFRPIQADMKIDRSFSDTVFASECDSIKVKLFISFSSCDFIRFQNVNISSPLEKKDYSANFTKEKNIYSSLPDTMEMIIFPHSPGIYPLQFKLHFASSDWIGFDTTLSVVVAVKNYPPSLHVSKLDTIHFGTSRICLADGKDTITLSNPSCETITINSVSIESDSITAHDFSLSQSGLYDLDAITGQHRVIINFHPLTSGIKSAKIIIQTTLGNDTIPMTAFILPDTARLIIDKNTPIDFGTKSICVAAANDTVILSNPGCAPVRINNILFETDSSTLKDFLFALPAQYNLLWNSQPGKITVHFNPQTTGIKFANIIIESSIGNDTIPIRATVLPDTCLSESVKTTDLIEPLQFTIRPNPSYGEIELDIESAMNQDVTIEIFDALGAKILSNRMTISEHSNTIYLDTRNLAEGIYIARVKSLSGSVSRRFVKIK